MPRFLTDYKDEDGRVQNAVFDSETKYTAKAEVNRHGSCLALMFVGSDVEPKPFHDEMTEDDLEEQDAGQGADAGSGNEGAGGAGDQQDNASAAGADNPDSGQVAQDSATVAGADTQAAAPTAEEAAAAQPTTDVTPPAAA